MTITTNTTYVQPAWSPAQQTCQIGLGANQAVTFNATSTYFNCELGSQFSVTLTASLTNFEVINPQPGQIVNIFIKQGPTGSFTVTTWDSFVWAAGTAPTLTTTTLHTDRISAFWNDTLGKWVGTSLLDIS